MHYQLAILQLSGFHATGTKWSLLQRGATDNASLLWLRPMANGGDC